MSDYWVDVQGYAVPLYLSEIGIFNYRLKPSSNVFGHTLEAPRRRHIKYKDRLTQANVDRLVTASLNEYGEIEAGYFKADGSVELYLSTPNTPRVNEEA